MVPLIQVSPLALSAVPKMPGLRDTGTRNREHLLKYQCLSRRATNGGFARVVGRGSARRASPHPDSRDADRSACRGSRCNAAQPGAERPSGMAGRLGRSCSKVVTVQVRGLHGLPRSTFECAEAAADPRCGSDRPDGLFGDVVRERDGEAGGKPRELGFPVA